MANTALNRTTQALLTNKSGGDLTYGAVVVLDNTNAEGFTTTTTAGLSTRGLGVILEPNGIANNASGMVAIGGWCPKVTLNTAATVGQFIKSHTVAGQGTPHSSPQVEGDFAVALDATSTPTALLFGSPNGPTSGGAGTVTNTGALAANALVIGNGGVDVSTTTTGTGILTALGVNVGTAGSPVVNGGALGTPSSGTLSAAILGSGAAYLNYQDQEAQNTSGGTFTSGAWRTRVLNTEVSDVGGYGTLASNQITLASGTYLIAARAPAYNCGRHQLRLQNVTDATTVLSGGSAYSAVADNEMDAVLTGIFTIGASKALELQHQGQSTSVTRGLGIEANFTTEIYATVELWKIG